MFNRDNRGRPLSQAEYDALQSRFDIHDGAMQALHATGVGRALLVAEARVAYWLAAYDKSETHRALVEARDDLRHAEDSLTKARDEVDRLSSELADEDKKVDEQRNAVGKLGVTVQS